MLCKNCRWYLNDYKKCVLNIPLESKFNYCTYSEKQLYHLALNSVGVVKNGKS